MPPRWFWGKKGGCFADFYAENPIFGHIGVSKLSKTAAASSPHFAYSARPCALLFPQGDKNLHAVG